MKLVVISDSHDNFQKVINVVYSNIDCTDCFIFLGDSLEDYKKIIKIYKKNIFLYAYGNCDYNPSNKNIINFFSPNSYHKIMYCHGHTLNVKNGLSNLIDIGMKNNATIILYGHTHISYTNYLSNIYIMNPGSVSISRNTLPPSYGIVNIKDNIVETQIKLL